MNLVIRRENMFKSLLLAVTLLFVSGCVGNNNIGQSQPAAYVEDTILIAKVKTAILQQKGFDGLSIHINAYKGVVQLSGFVDTDVNKELAGQIARSVDGVAEVVNNLIVKQ